MAGMEIGEDRKLAAVLDAFDGAGFVIDASGYYREVLTGRGGDELLYRDRDVLLGNRVDDVLPEGMGEAFREVIERAIAEHDVQTHEYVLDLEAGEEWFEGTVVPIEVDDGEAVVLWLARTITERKERERRRVAHQERIRSLLDAATEMQSCTEPQEVFDILVETAEEVLDFDFAIADAVEETELVPKSISEDVPEGGYFETSPLDPEANMASRVYIEGETHVEDDVHDTERDAADPMYRSILTIPIGDYGVFQAAGEEPALFDEDDRELGELLVSHAQEALARIDHQQTVQERTEELQRQYDRLEKFASIISHDLRNPLTVAQGYLDLISADANPEAVNAIETALDRLETILDGTLALARQGKTIGETEPIELAMIARQCWGTVSSDDADLVVVDEATIMADEERVKQVFENLFRNAVEHAGSEVTVEVGVIDHEGVYIEDNGPGIPPDERDAVFEVGYSTTEDGTGFGLAIVREIVEAHGWEIAVTDGSDGGARFEISGVTFA